MGCIYLFSKILSSLGYMNNNFYFIYKSTIHIFDNRKEEKYFSIMFYNYTFK